MIDSGILQQAVKIKKVNRKQATHFALCNGDKIRYLIAMKGEKKRLSDNISTYSGKLGLLMKLLKYLPFTALKNIKLGYYVRAELSPVIKDEVRRLNSDAWNMIVGTYDEKQKLVLQCYRKDKPLADFIKVGNKATEKEMLAEIEFLNEKRSYRSFEIPVILGSRILNSDCPFNLQITEEFVGDKVEPELTEDIVRIYEELAEQKKVIDGVECEFSHGDFAPWNLKKRGNKYTLFDWEHCGYRMPGFDLMHYATIVQKVLNGKELSEAFDDGLKSIHEFLPDFQVEKETFLEEFEKLRTQIS